MGNWLNHIRKLSWILKEVFFSSNGSTRRNCENALMIMTPTHPWLEIICYVTKDIFPTPKMVHSYLIICASVLKTYYYLWKDAGKRIQKIQVSVLKMIMTKLKSCQKYWDCTYDRRGSVVDKQKFPLKAEIIWLLSYRHHNHCQDISLIETWLSS